MNDTFYTFRPIVQWPGELAKRRVSAPFVSPWTRTLDLLKHELSTLNARRVVIQIALSELEFRKDGVPYADARPAHPGVILAFDSKYGPLQYATDRFDDWRDNLRAIALALEALRKVDRYGITKRGEQYTGWKALPDKALTREDAEELLRSYGGEREAVRRTHPDHGGNREEFDRVMAARRLLSSDAMTP